MRLSKRGFTLAELLLAAAILAFALTGLLALFINCSILNESNRNLTIAISHAQYVMENIKNQSFTNLETNINDGNCWDWNTAAINVAGLTALSSEAINTQSSGTNPLTVAVTVTWQDRNQIVRNTELWTLFTNY